MLWNSAAGPEIGLNCVGFKINHKLNKHGRFALLEIGSAELSHNLNWVPEGSLAGFFGVRF